MNVTPGSTTQDLKAAVAHTFELIQQNQCELAELQALEILRVHPAEVNALRALGTALRLQGKYEEAVKYLRQALAKSPGFALAQQELGLVYSNTGRINEAIEALGKALAIDHTLAHSWRTLGEMHLADGNEPEAQKAFQKHLKVSTRDRELLDAVELLGQNKIALAERACRSYLKRQPADVSAIRLLAEIGLKLKVFGDAEKLLERCLELAPDYHLARLNYASALSGRQKPELALEQLAILQVSEPEKPAHMILRASVLAQTGNYPEAIDCYEKLLEKYPPQAKILLSYGHALKTVGSQQQAIDAYLQAIELEPSLGEAYWSLANLKTFHLTDQDITSMEELIKDNKAQRADFFHLCFALGKALEDKQNYEASFKYYALGNKVKKQQEGYRSEGNHEECLKLINTCSTSLAGLSDGAGCQDPAPIFIVGLPRSGSTLLEQIIASHSMVDGTKELPDIIAIANRLGGRRKKADVAEYPEVLATLTESQRQDLGEEYLARAQIQRGDAPFFIDKMPNNFAHIGLIQLILPNAKIIDARRHPMDACFSGFKQLFASGQRFSYSLEDIGRYYRDYITLMDHWDAVLPGKILRVQYEDVISDTEQQVRRILEYCGLPFEDGCLNFYQTDRAIRTASSEQVRQPIYQSSVRQWQHYESHLGELKAALGPVLERYPLD